jgi:hypothetical protein
VQPVWIWDDASEHLIKQACFWKGESLPMGYPSSPVLSNIAMCGFDRAVVALLYENRLDLGDVVYTRYADDMVFSCQQADAPGKLIDLIHQQLLVMERPRLRINWSKLRMGSRAAGSMFITGLRLCQDRHLTLHRRYKDQTRLLLSLLQRDRLTNEDIPRLRGHLNHIKQVDRPFWYSLQGRYPKGFQQLGFSHEL